MVIRYFIIAGESSGDLLGAKLIKEIKARAKKNQEIEFLGIGGRLMQEEGFLSLIDMSELSVMGFVEVLPHIPRLLSRIRMIADEIKVIKPDYVITIDAPDFNFRVMKKLRNYHDSKKIHLIAPSVWAYREGRAKKIAPLYDLLLSILPFEAPYFTKHGLKTEFIGSPIVENLPDFDSKEKIEKKFRKKYDFSANDVLLYVTPGSRNFEVKKIFPEFIKAINVVKDEVKDLKVVIPAIDRVSHYVENLAHDLDVKYRVIKTDEKDDALMSCDFALAKSGTNTIEISLYKIPLIVCYKFNALTYFILDKMVTNRFANLINIIMNRYVITEHIQEDCQGGKIAESLKDLIVNKKTAKTQLGDCNKALKMMGMGSRKTSTKKAVDEILKL